MARRGGKAASRRSRQRKQQQRPGQPPQAPIGSGPARELEADDAPERAIAESSIDAFEKADAELRAATPPPGSRATVAPSAGRSVRARTSDFMMASGPSRLGERAADEYHYVLRDLRNIGVLLVVIAVLLAVSVVVVNLLDIGPA
jgi:hypothetical protein